jgi:hypothetical protein
MRGYVAMLMDIPSIVELRSLVADFVINVTQTWDDGQRTRGGEQAHFVADHLEPVAVMLDLVHPPRAGGRIRCAGRLVPRGDQGEKRATIKMRMAPVVG